MLMGGSVAISEPRTSVGAVQAAPNDILAKKIDGLIAGLGDRSYDRRNQAECGLIAVGPAATPALRTALAGESYEIAARAGRVLAILDSLLLAGVEVELSFSKRTIVWNDPVDLVIKLTNRSGYDARIPFEPSAQPAEHPDDDELRQLGLMLDAGDFLTVTGPGGKEIDSRVDDLTSEGVEKVLEVRMDDGPTYLLPASESATIVLRDFNRGWARYPLLDAGVTKVGFSYRPAWPNHPRYDELRKSESWVVTAKKTELTITTAAPGVVSRSGKEAGIAVVREQDEWVARITSTHDVPIWINANLGYATPFATCRWVGRFGESRLAVAAGQKRPQSLADFDRQRMVEVLPGKSLELARIGVDRLAQALADLGGNVEQEWNLQVEYLNLCDRSWQARQRDSLSKQAKVPDILDKPLPRRVLTLHLISATVRGEKR